MVAGTSGWIEHPAPAWWRAKAPTSFMWPPLRAIASSPISSTTDFDQCCFRDGPPAEYGRAPTRIVAHRMPSLHGALIAINHGKCPHPKKSHATLIGKHSDGSFKTSGKKTYPDRMCAAIAKAITSTIVDIYTDTVDCECDTVEIRKAVMEMYMPNNMCDQEFELAPDFAREKRRGGTRIRGDPEVSRWAPFVLPSPSPASASESAPAPAPDEGFQEAAAQDIAQETAEAEAAEGEAADFLFGPDAPVEAVGDLPFAPPLPPPPVPTVVLTVEQRARIRANREQARLNRLQRIAPWRGRLEFQF